MGTGLSRVILQKKKNTDQVFQDVFTTQERIENLLRVNGELFSPRGLRVALRP